MLLALADEMLGLNALSSIVCFLTNVSILLLVLHKLTSQCPLEHCMLSDECLYRHSRVGDCTCLNALSSIVCFLTTNKIWGRSSAVEQRLNALSSIVCFLTLLWILKFFPTYCGDLSQNPLAIPHATGPRKPETTLFPHLSRFSV